MAKNSIDAYGASGKSNVLMFDPDALHLVTDEASPLYDSRVHLPVDEAMVRNIMHHGVLEPILIAKNPETGATEVVVGRQRVKCAREANRRLAEQGLQPVQVPAVVRRGGGMDLCGVMASENAIRQDESPISRAEKMAKLISLGADEERVAVVFGCTPATVKQSLALLEGTAALRKAVDAGEIPVTRAVKLVKLPPEEQRAKVAELQQAAAGLQGHAKARAQRSVVETGPRMRGRKEIAKALETCADAGVQRVLSWVLGLSESLEVSQ